MRLEFNPFYCESLTMSSKDREDIENFSVVHADTGKGLLNYLKTYAAADEMHGAMRTYLVRMTKNNECVGYFSLKAGLVSLQEAEFDGAILFDTLPGVELANFAVNRNYVQKYQARGIGSVLFTNFIIPLIKSASEYIGVCLVYLFALPQPGLLKNYERYGFRRLTSDAEEKLHRRLKPTYDQSCIFMYRLLSSPNK